jgi:hypothetical protein
MHVFERELAHGAVEAAEERRHEQQTKAREDLVARGAQEEERAPEGVSVTHLVPSFVALSPLARHASSYGYGTSSLHVYGSCVASLNAAAHPHPGVTTLNAAVPSPLRLLVYDATQARRAPRLLGMSWQVGARLYRARGLLDASFGATNFDDALAFLARAEQPIAEIQFWGHGKWGRALVDRESFDRSALAPGHHFHSRLEAVRERLAPNALVWFRTCETLGAHAGQDFARRLADFWGARVAGHTFVIGFWQSGLHVVGPGDAPSWDPAEGLAVGTPERPERALNSGPQQPNTITCFTGRLPGAR